MSRGGSAHAQSSSSIRRSRFDLWKLDTTGNYLLFHQKTLSVTPYLLSCKMDSSPGAPLEKGSTLKETYLLQNGFFFFFFFFNRRTPFRMTDRVAYLLINMCKIVLGSEHARFEYTWKHLFLLYLICNVQKRTLMSYEKRRPRSASACW